MVSVAKTMGIMSVAGAALGAGSSYLLQKRRDNITIQQAKAFSKDGKIPIGGRTPDGKMWDGQISVEEFQKNLTKKRTISSVVVGVISAVGMALISGLTLALRGKIK